jgi:hypothetical protein
MPSPGMLRRVALVRTDVSEDLSASITTSFLLHFVFLRSVRLLLITANVVPSSPIRHSDDGGAKFLRNIGSYKSHTA